MLARCLGCKCGPGLELDELCPDCHPKFLETKTGYKGLGFRVLGFRYWV